MLQFKKVIASLFLVVFFNTSFGLFTFGEGGENWYKSRYWTCNAYAYNCGVLYIVDGEGDTWERNLPQYSLLSIDMSDNKKYYIADLEGLEFVCIFPHNDGALLVTQTSSNEHNPFSLVTTIYHIKNCSKDMRTIYADTVVYATNNLLQDVVLEEESLYLIYQDRIILLNILNGMCEEVYHSNSTIMNHIETNHCAFARNSIYIQESDSSIYSICVSTGEKNLIVENTSPKENEFGVNSYSIVNGGLLYGNAKERRTCFYNVEKHENQQCLPFLFHILQTTDNGIYISEFDELNRGKNKNYYIGYEVINRSEIEVIEKLPEVISYGYKDVFMIEEFGFIGYANGYIDVLGNCN